MDKGIVGRGVLLTLVAIVGASPALVQTPGIYTVVRGYARAQANKALAGRRNRT